MLDNRYKHKDIKGFEGTYALSESGKIYSYRRKKYLKWIKSKKDTTLYVGLYTNSKRTRIFLTEKLMQEYFG